MYFVVLDVDKVLQDARDEFDVVIAFIVALCSWWTTGERDGFPIFQCDCKRTADSFEAPFISRCLVSLNSFRTFPRVKNAGADFCQCLCQSHSAIPDVPLSRDGRQGHRKDANAKEYAKDCYLMGVLHRRSSNSPCFDLRFIWQIRQKIHPSIRRVGALGASHFRRITTISGWFPVRIVGPQRPVPLEV